MKPRVLVLHYTPPGVIGGAEMVIAQQVRHLRAAGFDVSLAAGREGSDGEVVHVIPQINVASSISMQVEAELAAGAVTPAFFSMRDGISERLHALSAHSDVVIAHNSFTLHFNLPLTAALWDLARRRGGGMVAWCHDLSWTNPLYLGSMHVGYPWNLLRLPAPDTRYVAVSDQRATQLEALWGGGEVDVIPNGIDPAEHLRLGVASRMVAERYRLFERELVLLLPVRVTRRKNIETGIRATAALKRRGRDVRFLITGPTAPHHPGRSRSYMQELLQLCVDLDVREEVVFLARELGESLSVETVSELYTLADALLFPSAQEGFGLPILEAGLARVPAILSDIPIFHEVAGDAAWYVDPGGDADTIAGTIESATTGSPSRLYRRVLHNYRWDAITSHSIIPLLRDAMLASRPKGDNDGPARVQRPHSNG